MNRVIKRCPNCGVEYDDPSGEACDVCGTPLRYWCRAHSKAIGWLNSPECPGCAAEAAARAPRAPTRAPPATPAPRVPPRPPAPAPAPPSRRTRVTPRHAPPAGWTSEPAPHPEPASRRDPRDAIREGAEDLGPYLRTGASVAARMFAAVLAVVRNVIVWGLIGALLAAGVAYYENADILWLAMFGAMVGGGVGLLFGFIRAIRILFAEPEKGD
jgi:hypothetical protein